jgi:Icc protein
MMKLQPLTYRTVGDGHGEDRRMGSGAAPRHGDSGWPAVGRGIALQAASLAPAGLTPDHGTMTTAIAHLSDPHITIGPKGSAAATSLGRALGRVLSLEPQPDCVVITGDLVEKGHREEYLVLAEILDGFPLPLFVTTGNHDDPAVLVDIFTGTAVLNGGDSTEYAAELPGLTIIALDSHIAGKPSGYVDDRSLAWLNDALSRRPDVPAFVCIHHPPIPVGIPFLDTMGLLNGAELAAVIAAHDNVVRVLTGHVHRSVTAPFAGTVLTVAPSTHLQSGLALQGEVPNYLPEPTSFLLHVHTGASWVTHSVPVSHAAAPLALF